MIDLDDRGSGPAVTLLHGFALDRRMWAPQVERLAATHRTIALDLPGFGAGGAAAAGQVCATRDIADVLDACGVERTHLVGHSFGGAVAVDFALAYPERVLSLSVVGALLLGHPTGIAAWGSCCAFARDGRLPEARAAWLGDALFASACARPDVRARVRSMVADYGCGHWSGRVSIRWLVETPAARLHDIGVPAVVASGEHDAPSFQAMAAEYAAKIPGARSVTIPGAGHMANLEAPDAFYEGVCAALG